MKNEFDVNDLKTGMRVTFQLGSVKIVMKDVFHGYYSSESVKDFVVDPVLNSHKWDSLATCRQSFGKIIKVEIPEHPYDIFYPHEGFRVIWEYKEETEQRKKIRELEETINKAQAQIEALKKETN